MRHATLSPDARILAKTLRDAAVKQGVDLATLPGRLQAWTDEQWATAGHRANVGVLTADCRALVVTILSATPEGGVDWYPDDMPKDDHD